MWYRSAIFAVALLMISSCRSDVTLDYPLKDHEMDTVVRAKIRIQTPERDEKLERNVPLLVGVNNLQEIEDYALVITERNNLMLYLGKEFRYELSKKYGSNRELSKLVDLTIAFENKTQKIEMLKVRNVWVDGVPLSEDGFRTVYIRPGDTVFVEFSDVSIATILQEGFGVLAVMD